jgi:hypothetical protein
MKKNLTILIILYKLIKITKINVKIVIIKHFRQ